MCPPLGLVAACVASAVGMAVAIDSPSAAWIGLVALVPLFASVRALDPRWAALAGGAWGLSLFSSSALLGSAFIPVSLPSAVLLTLVPAVFAFLACRMTRRVGFSPYLVALAWIGVELSLQPLGLRHGLLASTQGEGFVLGTIGSATGYAVVAFLVAYVNSCLLEAVTRVYARISGARVRVSASEFVLVLIGSESLFIPGVIARRGAPRAPPIPVL